MLLHFLTPCSLKGGFFESLFLLKFTAILPLRACTDNSGG
jgi:hypothetical protein